MIGHSLLTIHNIIIIDEPGHPPTERMPKVAFELEEVDELAETAEIEFVETLPSDSVSSR